MPPKAKSFMSDTLKKIAEKRGMMIVRPKNVLHKPLPADLDVSKGTPYLSDRIQGAYNDQHRDNNMRKSLDYAPYYYNNHWDKSGNYVPDKKHLIKKG